MRQFAVQSVATVLMAVVFAVAAGKRIVFPSGGTSHNSRLQSYGRGRLNKVTFNQDMYVQYVEFVADVPAMRSLSTCFWIHLIDATRTATVLNYAVDAETANDNITLQYVPRPDGHSSWLLLINGHTIYGTKAAPLPESRWVNFCHSWDGRTGEWSTWQNGKLQDVGVNTFSIGQVVASKGTIVTGQHQETLVDGMDRGEGIVGSLTLLHVSSQPIALAHTPGTQEYVRRMANDCRPTDRGDVVNWLSTPRRGYGGLTHSLAVAECGAF